MKENKTNEIKWSQWSPVWGMLRCGTNDLATLMEWMRTIGKDAGECLKRSDKQHMVYGRKIYGEDGNVSEVRFYADTYMTDEELDNAISEAPDSLFYVVHKN